MNIDNLLGCLFVFLLIVVCVIAISTAVALIF